MTDRYDLIIFRKYKFKGQYHYKPYIVGEARQNKKTRDYILEIPKGISITGRVILSAQSDQTRNSQDLVELYQSSAQEVDPL